MGQRSCPHVCPYYGKRSGVEPPCRSRSARHRIARGSNLPGGPLRPRRLPPSGRPLGPRVLRGGILKETLMPRVDRGSQRRRQVSRPAAGVLLCLVGERARPLQAAPIQAGVTEVGIAKRAMIKIGISHERVASLRHDQPPRERGLPLDQRYPRGTTGKERNGQRAGLVGALTCVLW